MRIARLELRDFRCHRHSTVTFDHVTYIAGPNNAGKSSCVDALTWCLTGRTRGTDARGAGAAQLKRLTSAGLPADRMHVTVEIEGFGPVTRTLQGASAILSVPDGTAGSALWAQQGALETHLGASADVLHAVLSGDILLTLPHAEAKALLMAILDVRVPLEGEAQPLTLAQLDARYQQAFDARKTAKAQLAAIQVPPAPAGELPDVVDIERRLQELREREKALIAEEAETVGARRQQRAALDHERQALTRQIRDAAAAQPAQVLATPTLLAQFDAEVARLERELAEEAPPYAETAAASETARARLRVLGETVTALRTHSPSRGCVLDSAIPCKTAAKAFGGQVEQLQAELDRLSEEIRTLEATTVATQRREFDLDQAKRSVTTVREELARREAEAARRAEREARLAAIDAELASLPADPGPSPERAQLQQRIAKGQQVLKDAHAIHQQHALHQERLTARQAAAAEVTRLEALVEQLGPKGIRVAALAGALEGFHARINQHLAAWGYAVTCQLEPWRVVVNGRGADLLSTSERLRVGLAVQLAIAEVTGLSFVAIDQVDLLDGANRAVLAELLHGWSGQVLIAATRDEPPVPIDGVTCYWLTAGQDGTTVERVEALAVA